MGQPVTCLSLAHTHTTAFSLHTSCEAGNSSPAPHRHFVSLQALRRRAMVCLKQNVRSKDDNRVPTCLQYLHRVSVHAPRNIGAAFLENTKAQEERQALGQRSVCLTVCNSLLIDKNSYSLFFLLIWCSFDVGCLLWLVSVSKAKCSKGLKKNILA